MLLFLRLGGPCSAIRTLPNTFFSRALFTFQRLSRSSKSKPNKIFLNLQQASVFAPQEKMEKGSGFSFGLSLGNSQANRNPVQRNLTPQNVMQDRGDDEDMDTEPTPSFSQSITSFDGTFKYLTLLYPRVSLQNNNLFRKPEEVKKFIVIPASAASIDETKPMLLRNRPEGSFQPSTNSSSKFVGLTDIKDEKEKYLYDVASRADDNTMANYNRVDVFKYGEGILRGLGWTPGAPVGKSNKGYSFTLFF